MALTILQILPSLKVGGVETGTVDLARALVTKGHRAIVISSGGPLVGRLEAAGVIHYALPVHRKVPWTIFRMAKRVAEVAESHGVDVVHARSRVPALIGFLATRRVARRVNFRLGQKQRIPVFITTAHGYYARHLLSRVMGWGRLVIAISEAVARHMIDSFRVPPERIRLIPRGVALERFPWRQPRLEAPKGEWRIATIGRITPIKGHRDLLKAFRIVLKSFPRATLSIVGEASPDRQGYFKELKGLVNELGLQERVEFTGHEPDVAGLLERVDLAVLPSIGQEAFGRVLIEAGASGVPVVATRVGGMAEVVVDRRSGLLVPPSDPMALSTAMITLLRDRELAVALSKENRRRIEALYPLGRMVDETLDVYQEASENLRILVIKFSAVGDLVLMTPSLRALRRRFPKAHLTLLVGRDGSELLNRCPYLNELIVFDRQKHGSPLGVLRMGKRLRAHQVDVVVDFQNNRLSHWIGFLSLAPLRYGYGGRRFSWLLTHRATPPDRPIPPVEHQFHLLQLLGSEGASSHLELWPGRLDEERAESILKSAWIAENQPIVAVHPSGSAEWLSKRWPVERYAQLIDELALLAKVRVVLTGSPRERPLAEEIERQAKVKPIVSVGLTSLNELAALLRRVQVFVGGDTAPLHIAAAVGTPIVALFGATDPVRHLPPAPSLKLLKKEIPCSPCYHRVCYRSGLGHMECMKLISVHEVAQAVLGFLRRETAPSQGRVAQVTP